MQARKSEVALVTPEIAAEWLIKHNHSNPRKKVISTHVTWLAQQILSGQWQNDHPAAIAFDIHGKLIDGQHRLNAIVRAGVAVKLRIEWGMPEDVAAYIDCGITRGWSDRVKFVEDPGINTIVAMIVAYAWTHGGGARRRMTADEAETIFLGNVDGFTFAAQCMTSNHRPFHRRSIRFAIAEMHQRNPAKAKAFAESLIVVDGEVQQARVFRDYMLRNPTTSRGGGSIDNSFYERGVYAMNAHLKDQEIKVIKPGKWTIGQDV